MWQILQQAQYFDKIVDVPVLEAMAVFPPLKLVQNNRWKSHRCNTLTGSLVCLLRDATPSSHHSRLHRERWMCHKVPFLDRMVGVPVEMQRQAPQETIEETIEVPKIVSQDRNPQRTAEQVTDIPVPQVVEEVMEVCKVFSQNQCSTANRGADY